MEWFRSYHGAPADVKLAICATRAGVSRAVAIAGWWLVLDHASQAEDRGEVSGLDPEAMAATLAVDEDDVARLLDAFRQKGLIEGERVTAWDRRQQRTADATAPERMRRYRERKKQEREGPVTPVTDVTTVTPVTPVTRYVEQSRAEQKAKAAGTSELVETGNACLEVMGADPARFTGNFASVQSWLNAGYSADEIKAAAQAIAARPGFTSPRSPFAYLSKSLPDEIARLRSHGNATGSVDAPKGWNNPVTSKGYAGLAAQGIWTLNMGPRPGLSGCEAPNEVQEAFCAATRASR